MANVQQLLQSMERKHDYLLAIDSDGCVFDSMEIKHKECFIPNIIKHYHLQAVSKYVRAAAEFVNLYSRWRGINRFPGLVKTFELLADWPAVQRRGVEIPQLKTLRNWIESADMLGNPALKKAVQATGDEELLQALDWSEAVNASVADMVRGVPPFPLVRETLAEVSQWADIIVCSATPLEALQREWREHDLQKFVRVIAGQEMGSKAEHIRLAAAGRYAADNMLMIGDAPGDHRAAKANEALFFPVNPGDEENSWERFFSDGAEHFRKDTFKGEYEAQLFADFQKRLPEVPPWI